MKTLAFLLEAARTSYQLGDQHLQKNDAQAAGQAYTHALVQCKQVLEQAPQSAKAYILAGMILQKVGEKSRARYAYQNALKYEPDDSSIQALLKTVDP
jgi:Tfp pilus assembly protein PilF